MRCMEKNTSLAFIRDKADLTSTLLDGKYYFTTHAMPGLSGAATHANISTFCDTKTGAVCQETPDADCAMVSKTDYQYKSCLDATGYYGCMFPPYCPGNYSQYMGGCYQAIKDFGTTPLDAIVQCSIIGGALAVPHNVATMGFLDSLVKQLQNGTGVLPTPALIGLNNAIDPRRRRLVIGLHFKFQFQFLNSKGDFTLGGLYTVGADVTAMATGPQLYYALNGQAASGAPALVSIPIGKADLTTAVCQFPGYSVCNDTQLPTYDLVVVTKSVNHTHLNGTAHFACPAGMGALVNGSAVTNQNTTCIDTLDPAAPYSFGPVPAPCNVCIAEPVLTNATSNWVNTTVWYVNTTITVTCNTSHEWKLFNNTQVIPCTPTGWAVPMPCYEACTALPPAAGSNMTVSNLTSNKVGATVTYNCTAGNYFSPSQAGKMNLGQHMPSSKRAIPNAVASRTLTCHTNLTWQPADFNLTQCLQVCLKNPQGAPLNGTTSWDGITRASATQVTLSCPAGQQMGDGNATLVITCHSNGNWTTVDPALMVCRTPVTVPFPDLPPEMTVQGLPAGGLVWQDLQINFTCPNNTMYSDGRSYITITYNGTQWLGYESNFVCLNTCSSDPLPPYNTIVYNYTGIKTIGTLVAYYCAGGRFINMDPYYYSYCDGKTWNLTDMPPCESKFLRLRKSKIHVHLTP
ncbi:uncharacterized protein [Macrobrachium rosenbergii]|uniref:uncharacterized protein n=1 Tax=Macrobrachium rosenbergii TaxID=79674 RepID=UPI0034D49EBE